MNVSRRTPRSLAPVLAPLLAVLLGCQAVRPTSVEELDRWQDAAAGVENRELARLVTDVWHDDLAWDPFWATELGDATLAAEIPRRTRGARGERSAQLRTLVSRARSIDPLRLSDADGLTLRILLDHLERERDVLALGLDDWRVDPLDGPQLRVFSIAEIQPHRTARERRDLMTRWSRLDTYVRQTRDNLAWGLSHGLVAARRSVEQVIEEIEHILAVEPFDSPLVEVATGGGRWVELGPDDTVAAIAHEVYGDAREQAMLRQVNLHLMEGERLALGTRVLLPAPGDPLPAEERGAFLHSVLTSVEAGLYPALASYRDFLRRELLPRARPDETPGLGELPDGAQAYRTLIRANTSLPVEECDPQALHDFGLAEVARIRREISALGQSVFGTSDVAAIQERLRSAPELHFDTREEVEAKAASALARARASMPRTFGLVPRATCEVLRVPPQEERQTTIAYYREPAADGTRPGRYYINTYAPETRPRYEAEVLAFHEAIPGHHLQIAIAQELEGLPLFRRHAGSEAFVEGWALYTERLADEMGLYSGDLDRLGMLSFDAWRASRLVVDTGLHAFSWSRQEAIDYLFANTLLARNNVENEVDRYVVRPAQALAYKVGQRELLDLRDRARTLRGAAFSYPEFHDRVLENGAVPLPVLREQIGAWLGE